MILKEVPIWDRPREKVLRYGVKQLSTAELLAIILRTGVKDCSALELSQQIITKLVHMSDLMEITVNELSTIKGIGPAKAVTILAAIEFARRIMQSERESVRFHSPSSIFSYLVDEVKHLKQEQLTVLYLNVKGELLLKKTLFVGTVSMIVTDSKEIFKWAYKTSSTGIILVHNHPSGDPSPSSHDIKMTESIIAQAKALGFIILDHIIIGKTYYSMKERTNIFG